jgi:hypothetical protein
VEHDARADACEVCDSTLRYWCRAHSREIGWLEGPGCHRCAEEAAPPPTRTRLASGPPAKPSPTGGAPAKAPARPPPPAPAKSPPLLSEFIDEDTPGSGERAALHATRAPRAHLWGEALTQAAVKTACGAVAGAVGGCVSALALGGNVASITDAAGAAAAMLGFAGFAVGTALGWAIVLDDG